MPASLVGPTSRRVVRFDVAGPLLARVLVHLVGLDGLDDRVVRRHPVAVAERRVLEAMAEKGRLGAVALQFAGQLGRGHALGETSEDQDDLDHGSLGAFKGGPGQGVEDPLASSATVVEDRGAMAAVDAELVRVMTTRARRSVGMKPVEESLVTGVRVDESADGKIHDDLAGIRVKTFDEMTESQHDGFKPGGKQPRTECPT